MELIMMVMFILGFTAGLSIRGIVYLIAGR